MSPLGDIDGDGVTDLAVGALGDTDAGGFFRGAVWIVFLKPDGTVKGQQKINDVVGNFGGTIDNNDTFGVSVASLGDLDGNGHPELAVGAPRVSDGDIDRGAVWILSLDAIANPWTDLGNGLSGISGIPTLTGAGTVLARAEDSRDALRPSVDVREPADDAVGSKGDVEAFLGRGEPSEDVLAVKLRWNPRVLGQAGGERDRFVRDVDSGDVCPEASDAQRVLSAVALEMHQPLAADVAEEFGFLGEQGAVSRAQEGGLVLLVSVVGRGHCVP